MLFTEHRDTLRYLEGRITTLLRSETSAFATVRGAKGQHARDAATSTQLGHLTAASEPRGLTKPGVRTDQGSLVGEVQRTQNGGPTETKCGTQRSQRTAESDNLLSFNSLEIPRRVAGMNLYRD